MSTSDGHRRIAPIEIVFHRRIAPSEIVFLGHHHRWRHDIGWVTP
jgi:hypothetical protein